METKDSILKTLKKEFDSWEEILSGLNDHQLTVPLHPSRLSVKDNVAHLRTWQTISIARAEAALLEKDPIFPQWPDGLDLESDDDLDQINAWIYTTNQNLAWHEVYKNWKEGFLRFLQIGEAINEVDMMPVGKYHWLKNYSLAIVFTASGGHHTEHREIIQTWLNMYGNELETS